jgi:hypothetical protein
MFIEVSGTPGMPKALTVMGMVVAVITVLIFVLDLAIGIPFSSADMTIDIGFAICGVLLFFLSWTTFRELA